MIDWTLSGFLQADNSSPNDCKYQKQTLKLLISHTRSRINRLRDGVGVDVVIVIVDVVVVIGGGGVVVLLSFLEHRVIFVLRCTYTLERTKVQ